MLVLNTFLFVSVAFTQISAESPRVFRVTKDQIREAQSILKADGLYQGDVSGVMDDSFRAAIKNFQRRNGLRETGTLNRQSLEKMDIELSPQQLAETTKSPSVTLPGTRNSTSRESSSQRQNIIWEPNVVMDNQLFPSFLITTATFKLPTNFTRDPSLIGSGLSMVGISVVAPIDGAKIKLIVTMPRVAETSIYEGVLPRSGMKYDVIPTINYRYDVLTNIRQPTIVNAIFTLFMNGKLVGTKTKPIRVRSVNDAPLWWVQSNGRRTDMPWMVAAYVNEDHPWIDQILREALNTRMVNSFSGYQGTQQDVLLQVAAIWNSLQRRGFRYSSVTTTSGTSTVFQSQYVRFLEDSIRTSQSNCLDGSVLFASILRKIGIDPIIIIIPGHAFVGFYLDSGHRVSAFLETTMMGNVNLRDYSEDGTISATLSSLLGADTRNRASLKSFSAAYVEGDRKYNGNISNFRRNIPGYWIVDIAASRKSGIMPIAH